MNGHTYPPLIGGFSMYATVMLVPALIAIGVILLVQWLTKRPPVKRDGAAIGVAFVGGALATTLGMYLGTLLDGDFGSAHAALWAVPVAAVMVAVLHFFKVRGLSALHVALALICGSGLPFVIEYALTGPGDGTGLWAIGLIFTWWIVGIVAAVVLLARWGVRHLPRSRAV